MTESRFAVVFDPMPEAADASEPPVVGVELVRDELDEIAELRRIGLEIAEPSPRSYTGT